MKFFSKATGGFYAEDIHGSRLIERDGEIEPNPDCKIPTDALEITDDRHAELMAAQTIGKQIRADVDGFPIAVVPEPETEADARERALVGIRAQRTPMLDALGNMAGRAARKGDTATAEAADVAADALLDITVWPAFLEAATYDAMKAAILTRYKQIAAAAPASVQIVFKEVFGS